VSVATVLKLPLAKVDKPVPCASIQEPSTPFAATLGGSPGPEVLQAAKVMAAAAAIPAESSLRAIVIVKPSPRSASLQSPDFRSIAR
jgi:hypothetical protein